MSDDYKKLREKEVALQEKQLFAQRVTAAASVANAAASASQAATLNEMRADMNAAAEATAKHQREMALEQELSNFRNRVLATLPLLKEEEKTQYLTEQLLPRIIGLDKTYASLKKLTLLDILLPSGVVGFMDNYTQANPTVQSFFETRKKLSGDCQKLKELEAESTAKKAELQALEKDSFFGKRATTVFIIVSGLILIGVFKMLDNTIPIILASIAAIFSAGVVAHGVSEFDVKGRAKYQEKKQLQIDGLKTYLEDAKQKIESLAGANEKLAEHDKLWANIKASFIDAYLSSEMAQKFTGELEQRKMLATISKVWREVVTEEQAFLPPSARLSFDEHWLPLLIEKDDWLMIGSGALELIQSPSSLKTLLLKLVEPNYEDQSISYNPEIVILKPFYSAVGN